MADLIPGGENDKLNILICYSSSPIPNPIKSLWTFDQIFDIFLVVTYYPENTSPDQFMALLLIFLFLNDYWMMANIVQGGNLENNKFNVWI